ncbi:hypothetical protein OGY35_09385 [Citrobacter sp. Ct235]|uniref:hypothetical protein n=1 Tax=Citrobacter sp. Ct235 TaxID=2985157 RepID=UPI0025788535|nr:hypothetical protein [Citrobacter sp. Ct235]MDM2735590.1 hypothetical protein [Citrobacter sp. Ct235]
MNQKVFNVAMSLIIGLLVSVNIYLYHQHRLLTHFECQGYTTVKNENYIFSMRAFHTIDGKSGQTVIEGELKKRNGESLGYVQKVASYDAEQRGSRVYIKNNSNAEIGNRSELDPILKDLLPGYFFYHNSKNTFTVYPAGDGGYLIGNNQYIYLYCAK